MKNTNETNFEDRESILVNGITVSAMVNHNGTIDHEKPEIALVLEECMLFEVFESTEKALEKGRSLIESDSLMLQSDLEKELSRVEILINDKDISMEKLSAHKSAIIKLLSKLKGLN
ncbi:hypothetical protein BM526_19755 (plasmid) [Alteromonas mediterranea]|uniref:hypothetical protein n=1 Tax=Alteromonas mediterranea TaxID=314275 RepID=UPI0009044D03|nr:hypothetical protein [Alteromonas mediterranea]APE04207.1 hypothetical protein BM526_19755 [Alteromonas mediterranea]